MRRHWLEETAAALEPIIRTLEFAAEKKELPERLRHLVTDARRRMYIIMRLYENETENYGKLKKLFRAVSDLSTELSKNNITSGVICSAIKRFHALRLSEEEGLCYF